MGFYRAIIGAVALASSVPAAADSERTPPEPLNVTEWITDQDYPATAIALDESGTVSFALTVTAEGAVSKCVAVSGTASDRLKTLTCQLVRERARFEPAQDEQGKAASGIFSGTVRWQIPEGKRVLPPAPTSGIWTLSFIVEADGSMSHCESDGTNDRHFGSICEFADVPMFQPILGEDGQPVRRRVRVETRTTVEDPDE